MKIKKITVENFKAVSSSTVDFDGCGAIVTAGNNKGKSTILRGLIDRFRGEKPEVILKEGEENGFSVMELTDGSRIEWKFTEKSESFSFITSDGIKMTTGVISAIGKKYFGVKFDIDQFLKSTPKEQAKMLSVLVGLDFTEIDFRYKCAYDARTDANREVIRLRSLDIKKPDEVEKPDIESLRTQKEAITAENRKLFDQYEIDNLAHQNAIIEQNKINEVAREFQKNEKKGLEVLLFDFKDSSFDKFIDFDGAKKYIDSLPVIPDNLPITSLEKPIYKSTEDVECAIEAAIEQDKMFDNYTRDMETYKKWLEAGKKAVEDAAECDKKVKEIAAEKLKMISGANIPEEFTFTEDGILYKGLPLTNNQISSSGKYIAALKLGAMSLGLVKSMHFDASTLDNNSLSEVNKWAVENGLQLLIERPDMDGGEIRYEII